MTIEKDKLIFSLSNNKSGQSIVEYLMLLSMISLIVVSILRSDPFTQLFGPNSQFFLRMNQFTSYTYRHGLRGLEDDQNYENKHDSFINSQEDTSRFFTPVEEYPQE